MANRSFDIAIRKRLWVGLLIVAALILLLSAFRYLPIKDNQRRPQLGLMTTLPLQWSEGGIEAAVDGTKKPHPAYARLSEAYEIVPIDTPDQLQKSAVKLLVLAQPRALSPRELVTLDGWVRTGGRILILADPALQWGSLYPLGDKRRPLFTSLLSPLFSHWGIELLLPIGESEAVSIRKINGLSIRTQTPGAWQALTGTSVSSCVVDPMPMLADCKVGDGRAILVADADLLDAAYWQGQGIRTITGTDQFDNMQWVGQLLSALDNGVALDRDIVGK
jgi:ABC-type uncharacterized transport system